MKAKAIIMLLVYVLIFMLVYVLIFPSMKIKDAQKRMDVEKSMIFC